MRRSTRLTLSLGIAAIATQPAPAQLLQDAPTIAVPAEPPLTDARSIFARTRNIAVAERMLPDFTAQGTSVGAFDVFAGLSVGALATSNLFANNDNRKADVALVVRPEVTARTSAGPYQVAAYARGDVRRFAGHASENTEEGLAGVQGSIAVGDLSSVTAGASFGSFITPRYASDSPVNAAKPLEYAALNAFAGGTIEGASTRVIMRADVARLRYREGPSTDGSDLFEQDRNRTRYGGLLRVERALSPAVALYVAGTANKITYPTTRVGGVSRDSKGYGAYVGVNAEVTQLMRADVRVGYIRQNFDLAGFRPIKGFGALGTITYFPTQLWTITATVRSTVEDSAVPGTGGFLHRGGSIRGDHELRRYLIASVEGGYYRDKYIGLPRRDSLPYADASLTYLSRRHWNARLGYRYLSRSCRCTLGVTDFDDHRLAATLTFQN